MDDKVINEKTIRCECGQIITGISKAHAESNLKNHKKSKIHKKNLKFSKR